MERMTRWMKVLVITTVTLQCRLDVSGQVAWRKAQSWKLYNAGDSSFVISLDSLKGRKYYQLSTDSMKSFLDPVTIVSSDIQPNWMGAYLITCIVDSETRKVLISYYGGFFYDEKSRRYYQIPASKKDDWRNYLDACLISIQ